MSSDQNTTVTFTADQLETIEGDAVKAEAAINQAGTQTPATGVWGDMYRHILKFMGSEGVAGPQAYWFQEAGAINADTLSDPAGFFVRDITALGLDVSLSSPTLQNISNAIGEANYQQIITNISNGTSYLSLTQQLQVDVGTAVEDFNLPIGSWGGSFYYWNLQYVPDSNVTIGQTIESSQQQEQIFITNNAQAMADTVNEFGMSELESQQASRDAFAQGFENLASGGLQSLGIAYDLVKQFALDVGDATAQQFMQWLNFGWLSEVFVADGSENVTAGSGSDVLFGGQGLGGVGNDTFVGGGGDDSFVFAQPTSGATTETIDDPTGNGQVAVLSTSGVVSLLGGTEAQPLTAVAGQADTWTDSQGTVYTFDPTSGDLTIAEGLLGSGNNIVVDNFDLGAATETVAQGGSADGYLGFYLADGITLTAGATDGSDPPAPNFTAGSTQAYTVSVDAPSTSAQTVTVTLTGAPASDFGLVSGTTIVPLNSDGTFTVTIPAGETGASFSLLNTGDVGSDDSLQLVASISNTISQNATISSSPLAQNYVEPAQDPFAAGVAPQLYYYGSESINGESVGTYSDVSNNSPTPVGSIADGNEFINLDGPGGESINGGTGSDTITGAFIQPANVNGGVGAVDVISANGGQDIINIGGDYAYPSQMPPVQIYGNSAADLAQAVSDAEDGTPTDEQGDLISTSIDDSTIVGGNGNDLIMSSSDGVIVAGPGDREGYQNGRRYR